MTITTSDDDDSAQGEKGEPGLVIGPDGNMLNLEGLQGPKVSAAASKSRTKTKKTTFIINANLDEFGTCVRLHSGSELDPPHGGTAVHSGNPE